MSEMLEQVRTLGDQLRWASELETPHIGTHSEILFAGMGGSGIAGDYAAAVAAPNATRITVHKGYGPVPAWAIRQRPLVIAASYSGNTEETLDFVTAAWESGLPVATISTGGKLADLSSDHGWPSVSVPTGLQPRAAAGYMLGGVLRLLEASGSVDDQRLAMVEAIDMADRETADGSDSFEVANTIADALNGRIPIIYGGGPVSGTVAQRWKTQINENVKIPAWYSLLPELDHNEIVGWETMPSMTADNLGIVVLRDQTDHDRVGKRIEITRDLTAEAVPWVGDVASSGNFTLTRLLSLTVVGDLMSALLADRFGVDPVPVVTIEKLKKMLVEE